MSPVVSDFTVIVGDSPVRVGDRSSECISPNWQTTFDTGGANKTSNAFLMMMVQGLVRTDYNPSVTINGKVVGRISNYKGAHNEHWFCQTIEIGENLLNKNGKNKILIEAAKINNNDPRDDFDDFQVKNLICHFKQKAG